MSDRTKVETAEVIPFEEKRLESLGAGLPVTREDLRAMGERIGILKEFVSSQLVEDVDYGMIQGCREPSLFQPGAQKLARLFGLTVRKSQTHREVDFHANYAEFAYVATVYHSRSGELIAQCEGMASSQEVKFRSRWKNGVQEETPVADILNSLSKRAQKRAMVGAVIEACCASDFFTQDVESKEEAEALGIRSEPKKVSARAPRTKRASARSDVPKCHGCGHPMMISKYNQAELYCNPKSGGCGEKRPREARA